MLANKQRYVDGYFITTSKFILQGSGMGQHAVLAVFSALFCTVCDSFQTTELRAAITFPFVIRLVVTIKDKLKFSAHVLLYVNYSVYH